MLRIHSFVHVHVHMNGTLESYKLLTERTILKARIKGKVHHCKIVKLLFKTVNVGKVTMYIEHFFCLKCSYFKQNTIKYVHFQ